MVRVPFVKRRSLTALLLAFAVTACLSPTLPLPPPSRPSVEGPDANGNVRLTGLVPPRSLVTALNFRTNLASGQQTGESGAYDFTLEAVPGDEILFWYSRSNVNSPAIVVVIGEPEDASGGHAGAGGQGPATD